MMMSLSWEQALSWLVLLAVLYTLTSGRGRFEIAAFGGLVLMGLLGVVPPQELFVGFANPALFTVAVVLVMSTGLVESGILTGLGQSIARRVHAPHQQIMALSLATIVLSTLMNNIGTIGLVLPTAQRMAARAGIDKSVYGMPLVYACILGGSITVISSSGNIIVSGFRRQALGESFRMFDFAPHGLAMVAVGIILWLVCRLCGFDPLKRADDQILAESGQDGNNGQPLEVAGAPRSLRNNLIVVGTMVPALILTAWGIVHPILGFGTVVLGMIATGILTYQKLYESINLPVLIFIGSMLSMTNILQSNGALALIITPVSDLVQDLPPLLLILALVFFTALLANFLDNSVAAVLMAPTVIMLYQSGGVGVNLDAMLMAVAAGSSLGLVLPSHQVTMVAMSATGFSPQSFMKRGAAIASFAVLAAALVITGLWV